MTQTDTLLRYRPWRGPLRGPFAAALAMARVSLLLVFRRRLYWGLFALGAMVFFFYFYGQYLIVWLTQVPGGTVPVAGFRVNVQDLTKFLDKLALNGTAHTFGNFIWFQGYVVAIVLALAGSVLVGNDFAPRQPAVLPVQADRPAALRPGQVPGHRGRGEPASRPCRPSPCSCRPGCCSTGRRITSTTCRCSPASWATAGPDRHAEPVAGGDGRVGAADGADGDALDGRLRLRPADGRVAGGRAEVRRALAADRPVERPVPRRPVVPAGRSRRRSGRSRSRASAEAALACAGVCAGSWLYLRRRVQAVEIVGG